MEANRSYVCEVLRPKRPENLDKLFDPFLTAKKTGEGTGLGQSFSYGIIQDHLGDIQVSAPQPV